MHCGMKLILTSIIIVIFQITAVDDPIHDDPDYVHPASNIREKEGDDDDDDDDGDDSSQVKQDGYFDDDDEDHDHDLDDDVGAR